jgi:hypothetical protein
MNSALSFLFSTFRAYSNRTSVIKDYLVLLSSHRTSKITGELIFLVISEHIGLSFICW